MFRRFVTLAGCLFWATVVCAQSALTIEIPAGKATATTSTTLAMVELTLRIEDMRTAELIYPKSLAIATTRGAANPTTATLQKPLPPALEPFPRFVAKLPNREDTITYRMAKINVPLPPKPATSAPLTLRFPSSLFSNGDALCYAHIAADGYLPQLHNLALVVKPNEEQPPTLAASRTVKMFAPQRSIIADPTATRTIDLANGVNATIPPTQHDMMIDLIPQDAHPSLLSNFHNSRINSLALNISTNEQFTTAPITVRIDKNNAFPAMGSTPQPMQLGHINPTTQRLTNTRIVTPKSHPRPKGATETRYYYQFNIRTQGVYVLQDTP